MAFDDRLSLRELTEQENAYIGEDERVMLVQAAQHRLRRLKLKNP